MSAHFAHFGPIGHHERRAPWQQALGLAAFLAITYGAAWIGAVVTTPNVTTWYAGLNKSFLSPPNGVFPIVWGILYTLMAAAAWQVWRADSDDAHGDGWSEGDRWTAIGAYFVQLAINVAWSFAFFGAHEPVLALGVIIVLLGAIALTIAMFWRISHSAAILLFPYMAWVAFAAVLNAAIIALN
ncbi:MAG TPA: TspO/MBR family protein [Bauldia sp.]|nr:TspO/MBR family protein [Bauldia sp.]